MTLPKVKPPRPWQVVDAEIQEVLATISERSTAIACARHAGKSTLALEQEQEQAWLYRRTLEVERVLAYAVKRGIKREPRRKRAKEEPQRRAS